MKSATRDQLIGTTIPFQGRNRSPILLSRSMKSKFIIGTPDEMQKSDYARFFVKDPTGFSAERNKAIIEDSIQKYDKTRAQKLKIALGHYEERADAVVSFIKSVDRGKGAQGNLEKYFGRKALAYLRGEQIRETLMSGMRVAQGAK